MKQLINYAKKHREVIEYIIFGVATTVVNLVVFFIFDTVLGVQYLVANFISIVAAIIFAYFTNKIFVFKSKSPTLAHAWREFFMFVSLRAVSGLFDMAGMWLMVDLIHLDTNIAKILVQFLIVALNYIFSKLFIFK